MTKNVKHSAKILCALAVCTALAAVFFAGCGNIAGWASSEKQLLTFKFEAANNPGLPSDVNGTIDEASKTVSLIVPNGTDITKLKANFSLSKGAQVFVKEAVQKSGATENDFRRLVRYTVMAENGSLRQYVVYVDIAPSGSAQSTGKKILTFGFGKDMNPDLSEDVNGFIARSGTLGKWLIFIKFPAGTTEHTVRNLKPTFIASAKAEVSVGGVKLESAKTAADFYSLTEGTDITVKAEDGSSEVYNAAVEIDLPNASTSEVQKYFGSYYGELNSPYFGKNKVVVVLEENKVTLYSTAMSMDYVNMEWEKRDDGTYTCSTYKKGAPHIKNAYGKGGYDFTEAEGKITVKTSIMGTGTTAQKGDDFVWTEESEYKKVTVHI